MNVRNLLYMIKEHHIINHVIIKKVEKNYVKEYCKERPVTEYMKNKKVVGYTINLLYNSLVIFI